MKNINKMNPIKSTVGFIIISILIIGGGFFIYSLTAQKNTLPPHIQTLQKMEQGVVNFSMHDLENKKISLSSFTQPVIIINFWATWCVPCVTELPSLNKLAKHFSHDIVVLAVSNEPLTDIQNFLIGFKKLNSNFIITSTYQTDILSLFKVKAFPETFILNKKHQLIDKIIGPKKWNSHEWKNYIKLMIQKQT